MRQNAEPLKSAHPPRSDVPAGSPRVSGGIPLREAQMRRARPISRALNCTSAEGAGAYAAARLAILATVARLQPVAS